MTKNILKTSALFFLLTITLFAQNPGRKLISINYSSENIESKINQLNLTVLHQFDSVLLTPVTENEISALRKMGVEYTLIDESYSNNKYFLIDKKSTAKLPAAFENIFDYENYSLVKNVSIEMAVEHKINPVEIKEKPFPFTSHKNIKSINAATNPDSVITNLTFLVNTDSITYFIQKLQDFKTRYCLAPNRKQVALWIKGEFERFGYEDVILDSFSVMNTWQYNVVATLQSGIATDKVIVIGGHHDSITGSTPEINAPGADDNASGTTAVLEIARVMKQADYKPRTNLKFVTFAAEEFGLYGGYYFAEKARSEGMNIHLMINHDMISYSRLPVASSRVDVNYYSGSENFADIAQSCIDKFSQCYPNLGSRNSSSSDSYAFYSQGYDAVYFEENIFTPNYHTDLDLITNANMPYCAEIIRASCATLVTASFTPAKIQNLLIKDLAGGTSLSVSWDKSKDQGVTGYNVYLGQSSGDYFKQFFTSETRIDLTGLVNGFKYFVGVSAVNNDGYESSIIENFYIPFNFTLDKGILVVDETSDGNGTITNPTDNEVDNFYSELLAGFSISELDAENTNGLNVSHLGSYSTVIWHGDDALNLTTLKNMQEDVKRYLNAGGNFLYVGYLPTKAFNGSTTYPAQFYPGDFLYDYLNVETADYSFGSRFYGAVPADGTYPNIYVDSNKTKSSTEFQLKSIESLYPAEKGKTIYTYDTKDDTTTYQGKMMGMPVGVEYLGEDFKTVVLSFPLYFIKKEEAKEFLKTVLNEKFGETYVVDVKTETYLSAYSLSQNYPNPFNPSTTITYSIPFSQATTNVSLIVYDILGREVATLVNKQQSPGTYRIKFNAGALPSGFYIYKMVAGNFTETKKLLLLK